MIKRKIAILGASYLQRPLVMKAKEMGLETHVFAWQEGNVVDDICDYYYNISILDKEDILKKCKEISINGIISIASDIAMPTVNYVANQLNLVGNSMKCSVISTDKFEMRKALSDKGVSCPKFAFFNAPNFSRKLNFDFPLIVKPTDRSGSRGVTKVFDEKEVNLAIEKALDNSISGRAIVEEFITGREFSVEGISVDGKHEILAITDKVTTGEPFFVELEHHQPARINTEQKNAIVSETLKVLDALEIKNGASHTEVFLTRNDDVQVIESSGRMGGDWIGSHIVNGSTGFDYLKAVLLVALNEKNFESCRSNRRYKYSGVYYVVPQAGTIESVHVELDGIAEIKDFHLMMNQGDQISAVVDGASKRAAILFYAGSQYSPFKGRHHELIQYKIK